MKHIYLVVLILSLLITSSAFAQDMAPSVTVEDQVSLNGTVVIAEVQTQAEAFIVIHRANEEGGIGPVVGFRQVNNGMSKNVAVAIDTSQATSTLFAMLHNDTGEVGVYEFGQVEGADGPVIVDGAPLAPAFNVEIVRAYDQMPDMDSITIANIVTAQDGFIVIHSDGGGRPGPVLGFAPVSAGSNNDVTVALEGDITDVVFPMLHVDTGTAGEYEFGQVEGADGPVVMGGRVATFPITIGKPAMRIANQIVIHADNNMMASDMATTLTAESVVSEGDGWLVIHADNGEGRPGPVIGQTAVSAGTNTNVVVELDAMGVTPTLFPMLHVDTGEVGVYEFGQVEGADGPVVVDGAPLVFGISAAPSIQYEGTLDGTTLTVESANIDAQGWLVIHSDNNGAPGPVLGAAAIVHGSNNNIVVELSEAPAGDTVFPMLHYDTGMPGAYEFGQVEGADGPVVVDGAPVVGPMVPTAAE